MPDMSLPGAYFEDARDYCKAMMKNTEQEIRNLQAKNTVYEELFWKLESAIDKEQEKRKDSKNG